MRPYPPRRGPVIARPGTSRQPIHARSLQKNAALIAAPTAMTPVLINHAGRALATGAPR